MCLLIDTKTASVNIKKIIAELFYSLGLGFNMKTLVTGAAGFNVAATIAEMLRRGETVLGIDNHNDYYDPQLKLDRFTRNKQHLNYLYWPIDITDIPAPQLAFNQLKPQRVLHLAAQLAVQYSVIDPSSCVKTNIVGFSNFLEYCKNYHIEQPVHASTSSVYGANTQLPFSTSDRADHTLDLYAAIKRFIAHMGHKYSNLYGIATTGLRFFYDLRTMGKA